MKKWEYSDMGGVDTVLTNRALSALGEQGWELVTIYENRFYFKRLKEEITKTPAT